MASAAEDRALLLEYVLELDAVQPNIVWPVADRSAVDARQVAGHPIDLDKVILALFFCSFPRVLRSLSLGFAHIFLPPQVDVADVLRSIRAQDAVDLTAAVARTSPVDNLKKWLPSLCAVREFREQRHTQPPSLLVASGPFFLI